jgi:hypothetical protein
VANTLKLFWRGAVGFIVWLGLWGGLEIRTRKFEFQKRSQLFIGAPTIKRCVFC